MLMILGNGKLCILTWNEFSAKVGRWFEFGIVYSVFIAGGALHGE